MDPHSRRSQFNNQQGRPKTGPELQTVRNARMELKTTSVFDQFRKSTSASSFSPSSPSSSNGSIKDISNRPIASNSRLRKDEKYKRDMYLAFVDNALVQKARGVTEHYDDLVRQFSPELGDTGGQPLQPAVIQQQQLRAYLTALSHVVSKLDRAHIVLVDAIVSMPWTIMDSTFVKAYISFVSMLVSARPEYLALVLERAAQNLTYHSAKRSLEAGFAESSSAPLTRRLVYERVHALIAQLLELIPTLPSALHPLLARNFPHKRQHVAEHVTYIRNLLQLSDYCPELWDRILELIMDRTLQIDVEIQVELEELEAEGAGEEAEEVFQLDIFDTLIGQEGEESDSDSDEDEDDDEDDGGLSDLSSDDGSVGSAEEAKEEETNVKHVKEMVAKLDSVLEVIFKHLDRLHKSIATPEKLKAEPSGSPPASDRAVDVPELPSPLISSDSKRQALAEAHFHSLLAIFERTILRTFKSRYTQFIIFWYSSLDNQFRDRFLGTVVSYALLNQSQPVVTRAAAASYVASYVSRASFVAREEAQMVVRVMCQFLDGHLDEFDAQVQHPTAISKQSMEQHSVFYAVAQAVFLIFCFRWRDLTLKGEDGDDEEEVSPHRVWMPHLNVMQRVVNSALNPLRVCSSSVVQQFARVAQRVGFVYCFSIIEANKRTDYVPDKPSASISTSSSRTSIAQATQHFDADLTTFFPFDPFKLPRSSGYIEGIYRDWTSVAIADSDDEEEEDEEVEVEGEGEDGKIVGGEVGKVAVFDAVPLNSLEDAPMHGPLSLVDNAVKLGESFGGMSISPGPIE